MGPLHTLGITKLQALSPIWRWPHYTHLLPTVTTHHKSRYTKSIFKKIRNQKPLWMPFCTPNGYFSHQKTRETNVYIANKGKKKRLLLSYGTSPTFNCFKSIHYLHQRLLSKGRNLAEKCKSPLEPNFLE